MSPRFQPLLVNLGALALISGMFWFLILHPITNTSPQSASQKTATSSQTASASIAQIPISPASISSLVSTSTKTTLKKVATQSQESAVAQESPNQVARIQNPYPFPPESSDEINAAARAALVNIVCGPRSGGSLSSISGSGVLIDPHGVILTNAHVAQYVLLSEDPRVDLSCVVRMGTPATAQWVAETLYVPPVWVEAHANEILTPHPTGTGEHDYGLLLITSSVDGSPLPAAFSSLPFDTREAIGFQGDQVLVASYPAEFLGDIGAAYNLFPASSVTTIGQLLTFDTNTVDLLSLGGIIEAQSGSSGGAVVNGWGRLIGLIVTTSEGTTTADRNLNALALSYINTDIATQSGLDLKTLLGSNLQAEAQNFNTTIAPNLVNLYIPELAKQQ